MKRGSAIGAASFFEDIEKCSYEALSQISEAAKEGRLTETSVDKIIETAKRIVHQEYDRLLKMKDIITSPDFRMADEMLRLRVENSDLRTSCNAAVARAAAEIATLSKRLEQANQNLEVLRARTRRLDHELHEAKQRRSVKSRRG